MLPTSATEAGSADRSIWQKSLLKMFKEHNSKSRKIKVMALLFCTSSHVYMSVKFHENISNTFQVTKQTKFCDGLVIIAESLEECVRRLLTWKEAMEKKGLRVNAGKTKIMICGMGLDLLQSSGEFPCAVCRIGVGSNSIFCTSCKHWVHKKCSGLKRLIDWLCWGLTTCQPLRVILCRLPEKGRKEIEEIVEEMKERDREESGTGVKVKK